MSEKIEKETKTIKKTAKASKQEKLAQALRANLIRRKQTNSSLKIDKNQ